MRYYTYKITFEDLPGYFYYGKHKHKNDLGKYLGTPQTWKHLWKQFVPQVQILQWYGTWGEVSKAEESILRATWDSPYSLNENVGGSFSEESCRRGGNADTKLQRVGRVLGGKKGNAGLSLEKRRMGGLANTPLQRESRSRTGKENVKRMNSHPNTLSNQKIQGKNSDNLKREYRPVICLETGVIYPSAHEAHRKTGVSRGNISSCCAGKRKNAGGYHWHYYEENK